MAKKHPTMRLGSVRRTQVHLHSHRQGPDSQHHPIFARAGPHGHGQARGEGGRRHLLTKVFEGLSRARVHGHFGGNGNAHQRGQSQCQPAEPHGVASTVLRCELRTLSPWRGRWWRWGPWGWRWLLFVLPVGVCVLATGSSA